MSLGVAAPTVRFGDRTLPADRAAVMAILTGFPTADRDAVRCGLPALSTVDRAVHEGADIVDLGDVLTGPGTDTGSGFATQTRRVVSFVAAVRDRHPELLISVPGWRPEMARPVVEAGADILDNIRPDVDPAIAEIAAEYRCGLVCSRPPSGSPPVRPQPISSFASGSGVVFDVVDGLAGQAATLVGLGVPREAILIDPTSGLSTHSGLGKDTRDGLELLRRCDDLVASGWPVLMTLSSTDVIGQSRDAGRDGQAGALAATAIAAWARVRVFRAHHVRQTRRVLEMVASIAGTRPPARAVRGLP